MTISQPPTDSLYKFCAIAGLVILVASMYFSLTSVADLEDKIAAVQLKQSTNQVDQNYVQRRLEGLGEIIDNSIANQQKKLKVRKDRLTMHYSDTEIKAMISEVELLVKANGTSTAEETYLVYELMRLSQRVDNYLLLDHIAGGIGGILAVFGFLQWYRKIQKLQDQILSRQAKSVLSAA